VKSSSANGKISNAAFDRKVPMFVGATLSDVNGPTASSVFVPKSIRGTVSLVVFTTLIGWIPVLVASARLIVNRQTLATTPVIPKAVVATALVTFAAV